MFEKFFGSIGRKRILSVVSAKMVKEDELFLKAISAKKDNDLHLFQETLENCKNVEGYSLRVVGEYIALYCALGKPMELQRFVEARLKENNIREVAEYVVGYLNIGLVEKAIPLVDSIDLSSIQYSNLAKIVKGFFSARHFEVVSSILSRSNYDQSKPDLTNIFAKCCLALGKVDEARDRLEFLLETSSDDECKSTLIYVYANLGELEKAQEILLDLADRGVANQEVFYAVAYGFFNQGNVTLAQKNLALAMSNGGDISEQMYFLAAQVSESLGDNQGAENFYVKAMDLCNGDASLIHGFACFLFRRQDVERAKKYFSELLERKPNDFSILNDFGSGLFQCGYLEDAIFYYEKSVNLFPESTVGLNNYAVALREVGRFEKANEIMEKAISLSEKNETPDVFTKIDSDEIRLNQIMAGFDLGRNEGVESFLSDILLNDPENSLVRFYRSLSRLVLGDFEGGWEDYQSRWDAREVAKSSIDIDDWHGEMIGEGSHLLVYSEQGIGDEIMFASCIHDMSWQGQSLVIECDRKLVKLFRRSFPRSKIVEKSLLKSQVLKGFFSDVKYKTPIGDLPLHFRRDRESFQKKTPFFVADFKIVNKWRDILMCVDGNLKIGVSWKGGTKTTRRLLRSLRLLDLMPLFKIPGITWVNLQYSDVEEELREFNAEHGITIHSFQEAIDDYDETAALVKALDCVVSVQTAIVHLAGALGTNVHCMLPSAPEWRYRMGGDGTKKDRTMLWYPTVRMYTQKATGDWSSVVEHVRNNLLDDLSIQKK